MATKFATLEALRSLIPGPTFGQAYLDIDPIAGRNGDGSNDDSNVLWEYRLLDHNGQSFAGTAATGTIQFINGHGGTAGDQIIIDGHVITLVPGTPGAGEVQIGINANQLRNRVVNYINANSLPVTATVGGTAQLVLTAVTPGLSGNLIPVTIFDGAVPLGTTSGPLLSGGTFSAGHDWEITENKWDANGAPIDKQPVLTLIKAAPIAQPSGSHGVWTPVKKPTPATNFLRPDFFGDYNADPGSWNIDKLIENRRMLQAAIWVASNHPEENYVVEIHRRYFIWGPVRLMDNVEIRGTSTDAAIINKFTGSDGFRAPVQAGGWQSRYTPLVDRDEQVTNPPNPDPDLLRRFVRWTDAVRTGQTELEIDLALSSRIPEKSVIMIRNNVGYYANKSQIPGFFSPNVVDAKSISSSDPNKVRLTLLYDVPPNLGALSICNGSNVTSLIGKDGFPNAENGLVRGRLLQNLAGQSGEFFGGPITVVRNAKITGVSLESHGDGVSGNGSDRIKYGPAFAPGQALLDCHFDIPKITARSAVYVNCLAHSTFKVTTADVWEKGVEIALGSFNSRVEIGTVTAKNTADTDINAIVNVGENSRDISVKITKLVVESTYPPNPNNSNTSANAATMIAARAVIGCTISVKDIEFKIPPATGTDPAPWNGQIIGIFNTTRDNADMHDTQSDTKGIKIFIGNASSATGFGAQKSHKYIVVQNEAGVLDDYSIKFDRYIPMGSTYVDIDYPGGGGEIKVANVGGSAEPAIWLRGKNLVFEGIFAAGNISYLGADPDITIDAQSRYSGSEISPTPSPIPLRVSA